MTTEDLQKQTLEGLLTLEYLLLQLKNSCTIDLASMKLLEGTQQILHALIAVNCIQNQINNEPERA